LKGGEGVNLKKFTNLFNFDTQKKMFLGIEEEFWLTDSKGFLVNRAVSLLHEAAKEKLNLNWSRKEFLKDIWKKGTKGVLNNLRLSVGLQPELPLSQIEINTNPCPDFKSLEIDLLAQRGYLFFLTEKEKIKVLPTATPLYPFAAKIFPLPYYQKVQEIFADKIKKGFISGQHIHIGVADESEAIKVFNLLREYLPIFLALSTNSPISEGTSTSLHSARYFKYRVVAGQVIPNPVLSWKDYYGTLEKMMCLDDPTRNWKILRIHPYGTVEIRVSDIQLTAKEAIFLAVIAKVLAFLALNSSYNQQFSSLESMESSLLRSAVYGLSSQELRQSIIKALSKLTAIAKEMEIGEIWQRVLEWVKEGSNGSQRQLKYLAWAKNDPEKLFQLINNEFINEL